MWSMNEKYISLKSRMRQKGELTILVYDSCDGNGAAVGEGEMYSTL